MVYKHLLKIISHLDSGFNSLLDQHYPVYVLFIEYVKITRHNPCIIALKMCDND